MYGIRWDTWNPVNQTIHQYLLYENHTLEKTDLQRAYAAYRQLVASPLQHAHTRFYLSNVAPGMDGEDIWIPILSIDLESLFSSVKLD